MFYTDNPVRDFENYDREQERKAEALPHCEYCGCTIHESYYNINGEILCPDCLDNNYKHYV